MKRIFYIVLPAVLSLSSSSFAQQIVVFRTSPTGWSKTVSSESTIAFPSAAALPPTLLFSIKNPATSGTLLLTGTPFIQKSGADTALFQISQPATGSLGPGVSATFLVTYTPTDSLIHTVTITIASNATPNPYVIHLKGCGNLLFGSQFPPPGNFGYGFSNTGNIGRPGGANMVIANVGLSLHTPTFYGPKTDSAGNLKIQCSLDGPSFTGAENFTYSSSESNRSAGILTWRGSTWLNTTTGNVFVYLKCVQTTTRVGYGPVALTDPDSIGLSEEVGGLLKFNGIADVLNANYLIYASTDNNSFTPYLDFYDNYPKKTCGVCACVSLTDGFYWKDLRPALAANVMLTVNEGATAAVNAPANLDATDAEDLPAHPEKLVFRFETLPGPNPLAFGTGVMKLNNIPMTTATPFTLLDLRNNLVTFTHDGGETLHDEFQFSVRDGNGLPARDGIYTTFSFNISVTPVNDPPSTADTSYTFSYSQTLSGVLTATDPDNESFTFHIVAYPTLGNITTLDPASGEFNYNPLPGGPGTDFFTYCAYDGALYSDTSTVVLNLINLPPVAGNVTLTTQEDIALSGTLTATDPENGTPLTFQKAASPVRGIATVLPSGAYNYTPYTSAFGGDCFTYRVQDPLGLYSTEDTVFIRLIPRLDPGDLLVADQTALRLFDPLTQQDTVLTANQMLSDGLNLAYRPGTSVFLFDKTQGVIKINPVTGNQSLLSPRANFSGGAPIGGATGMLLDPDGQLVVADATSGIVGVDTTTGVVTPLFSGGMMQYVTGLTRLNNGDLIVTDAGLITGGASKILRITPAGIQSLVTVSTTVKMPTDVALMDQNTAVVCDAGTYGGGSDNVYKIALSSGTLTLLSTGGMLAVPTGIGYRDSLLYVVNNSGTKQILDIDPVTGAQAVVPGTSLDQPWGLMVVPAPVPANRLLQNIVVPSGQSSCYHATGTITVAGGGTTFIVHSGGSATLIAGVNILFEPGTKANSGAFLHGYVDPGGPWCITASRPVTAAQEEIRPVASSSTSSRFLIYPNPTTGQFTLLCNGTGPAERVFVEIFNQQGVCVLKAELSGREKHELGLTDQPAGLYFVRVRAGATAESFKLVRTQ